MWRLVTSIMITIERKGDLYIKPSVVGEFLLGVSS